MTKKEIVKAIITNMKGNKRDIGFTHFKRQKNFFEITHGGNMSNGISSVNENLEIMFNIPNLIEKIKDTFTVNENGSPDYMYELRFK